MHGNTSIYGATRLAFALLLIGAIGCSDNPLSDEGSHGDGEGRGEHGVGGDGGESGLHQEEGSRQLPLDRGYDQVRNGARLIMGYVASTNAFVGTVENTTEQTLRRVRVEVHLSDGVNTITAELGPTTSTDLEPGAILTVELSADGQTFGDWAPHVEVGSGDGGSEGGGEHGGEGNESAGHAEGGETDPASPILALDQAWDGLVNGLRIAMRYDPNQRVFSGTVENVTAQTICQVQIELNLKQGTGTVIELGPDPVGDLAPGSRGTIRLLIADEPAAEGLSFDAWQIHPEASGCNSFAPGESGESGEGSGHNEGSESSEHEGGGESGEHNEGREGG